MKHEMNLHTAPFEMIKKGSKTIEMRLHDEKRSLINIGDYIEFNNVVTHEKMLCVVKNLYYYNSFEELYLVHDKISIGYKKDEVALPEDMLLYYSKEKIERYGVVGIEIKVVEK